MRKINRPPLIIACVLIALIASVYSIDHWFVRQGKSSAAVHAQHQLRQEIDLRFRQGVLMLHARQFDHALTAFHRVLQLAPKMPEAHVNMGYAMLGKEKFKEARDFFGSALALRPEQTNAHYGSALALKGLGDTEEAIIEMHRYVMVAPADDPYKTKAEQKLKEWREEAGRPAIDAKDGRKEKVGAGRTAR